MKRFLLFLILIAISSSCTVIHEVRYTQSTLNKYIGCNHSELVKNFGAPKLQTPDGAGGYILVFEGCPELFEYSSRYAAVSPTRPAAHFFMTQEGICYRVKAVNTDSVAAASPGGIIATSLLLSLALDFLILASTPK